MSVNLMKGGRVDLQKQVPGLKRIRVGLGWKENKFSTGGDYDLDVTAFILKHDKDGNPKCADDKSIIFYNNLQTAGGEIKHSGDNRNGASEGDDETIHVNVEKILSIADEVSFVITIHDAAARKQNFGQIDKSYVKIYNDEDGKVIAEYPLDEKFSNETAVQVGSLYKNADGNLGFKAVGQGYNLGLADFCKGYGLDVA
jgi:tellurium resistance protein TerD